MQSYYGSENGTVKAFTDGVEVEDAAIVACCKVASLPFIHRGTVVMLPDCHVGYGAAGTIGTCIPTVDAIIPAAVGVDIGCGMIAAQTNLRAEDLPESLGALRSAIEVSVPMTEWKFPMTEWKWNEYSAEAREFEMGRNIQELFNRHPNAKPKRPFTQLATLGGGNHFIELCLDTMQNVWVMLHSGSRGAGASIGNYFIELAKKDMRKYFINLPDESCAYFPEGTDHFDDYLKAMMWAQDYARVNRELMLAFVLQAMRRTLGREGIGGVSITGLAVNCHHNYVARENHYGRNVWVTRKGAIRAREGDLGIIPGSMGARSYIVRGKGNAESFHSAPHGAGRRGSRKWAKATFTVADHVRDTEGVECRKDQYVIDETPLAYKNIEQVMDAAKDLVEPLFTLKQILCVKG